MQSPRASSPSRNAPSAPSLDQILQLSSKDIQSASDETQSVAPSTVTRRRPRKLEVDDSQASQDAEIPRAEPPEQFIAEISAQQTPVRRRPRKLNRAPENTPDIRTESNGGVAIPGPAIPRPTTKDEAQVGQQQDKETEDVRNTNQNPSQPASRRRPRKLNRNRSANASDGPQPAVTNEPEQMSASVGPVNNEMEALKERVRYLEGQVRELYERPQMLRSPRRRGKGRKSSQDTMIDSSDELARLQEELAAAQNELAALKAKAISSLPSLSVRDDSTRTSTLPPTPTAQKRATRTRRRRTNDIASDDEVEDITRTAVPAIDSLGDSPGRAVTLSGNYKIRLPDNLDVLDVRAIQDGVTSAKNIARTLANRASSTGRQPRAAGNERPEGQSWSEWFGGYSQTVARIMQNVEAEAAVESTPITPKRMEDKHSRPRKERIRQNTKVDGESGALVQRSRQPAQSRPTNSARTQSMVEGLIM